MELVTVSKYCHPSSRAVWASHLGLVRCAGLMCIFPRSVKATDANYIWLALLGEFYHPLAINGSGHSLPSASRTMLGMESLTYRLLQILGWIPLATVCQVISQQQGQCTTSSHRFQQNTSRFGSRLIKQAMPTIVRMAEEAPLQ